MGTAKAVGVESRLALPEESVRLSQYTVNQINKFLEKHLLLKRRCFFCGEIWFDLV